MNEHEVTHATASPQHVIAVSTYLKVAAALFVLTATTIGVAFLPLGAARAPIALAIATVKASLVALIFMHLLYDDRFNAVVFVGSVLFVLIFFAFTLVDPLTRGDVTRIERRPFREQNPRGGWAGALLSSADVAALKAQMAPSTTTLATTSTLPHSMAASTPAPQKQ